VKQKDVLLSFLNTHLVNESSLFDDSATTLMVSGPLRIDVAVGVIEVEDCKILGRK
jgi:hypothetical protein